MSDPAKIIENLIAECSEDTQKHMRAWQAATCTTLDEDWGRASRLGPKGFYELVFALLTTGYIPNKPNSRYYSEALALRARTEKEWIRDGKRLR